jgi:protein-L-isoaspartate(D-aspartate) O-methyltransferase
MVAAAASTVPPALLNQLAAGGRLMLPVGTVDQSLCLFERTDKGVVETRFDPVRFVPLLSGVE